MCPRRDLDPPHRLREGLGEPQVLSVPAGEVNEIRPAVLRPGATGIGTELDQLRHLGRGAPLLAFEGRPVTVTVRPAGGRGPSGRAERGNASGRRIPQSPRELIGVQGNGRDHPDTVQRPPGF
jgi:hypothetical protein